MWKELLGFGKELFTLTRKTQQNAEAITALQRDMNRVGEEIQGLHRRIDGLSERVQRLSFEQERDRENAAREREIDRQNAVREREVDRENAARDRENLLLRLEIALLRFERRLPPGSQGSDTPEV